jgi:hypothetical protein
LEEKKRENGHYRVPGFAFASYALERKTIDSRIITKARKGKNTKKEKREIQE